MVQRLLSPANAHLLHQSRIARAIPKNFDGSHDHQPFGYASVFGLEGTCARCEKFIVRATLNAKWRTHLVIQEWP